MTSAAAVGEAGAVVGGRDGDVGVAGGVVVAVGPVVVGRDQGAVGGESGGLPVLVGGGLLGAVGDDRQLPWVDDGAGERAAAVGGHAVQDVVVAAPVLTPV